MHAKLNLLSDFNLKDLQNRGWTEQIKGLMSDLSSRGVGEQWAEYMLMAITNSNTIVIFAEIDGAVVGVVTLSIIYTLRGCHGEINDLVVKTDFRGRGVGRQLMESARGFAIIRECTRIKLTSGEHRTDARGLYTSLGYELKETGVFVLYNPKQERTQ